VGEWKKTEHLGGRKYKGMDDSVHDGNWKDGFDISYYSPIVKLE
jgi:hypothetical protein